MFPSGGKRESQGADNAEGDRNDDENGILKSWQPKDYHNTVSTVPDTQTLLAGPTLNRKQRRDNNVTSKTTEYQQSFLLAQAFKPSFTEL